MNSKVTEAVRREEGGVRVKMEAVKGGKEEELEGDVLLVCIGRRAFADGLGLEVSGFGRGVAAGRRGLGRY